MKETISRKQLREFGIIIGLGFPLFIGWIIPTLGGHLFRSWTIWIGIPFLIIGFLNPNYLLFLYKSWIKLGYILGWINSRIILGIIFIVILQPIALIMKIFKYDPLQKNKTENKSYKEFRKQIKIDLNRIF